MHGAVSTTPDTNPASPRTAVVERGHVCSSDESGEAMTQNPITKTVVNLAAEEASAPADAPGTVGDVRVDDAKFLGVGGNLPRAALAHLLMSRALSLEHVPFA